MTNNPGTWWQGIAALCRWGLAWLSIGLFTLFAGINLLRTARLWNGFFWWHNALFWRYGRCPMVRRAFFFYKKARNTKTRACPFRNRPGLKRNTARSED